ncbi:MAG: hypothetical protein EOP56_15120 [Sphingobacteriales bacterium]|nr:MAG: hypothetical protein EOP56_15120 [Sphingobacteriales bacterium]
MQKLTIQSTATKIESYKFSCVTWQIDAKNAIIEKSAVLEEKFFSDCSPLTARREGFKYFTEVFNDIQSANGHKPTLAFHLRLYFVCDDGLRYCIYSTANFIIKDDPHPQVKLFAFRDFEVDLYVNNRYDLGGKFDLVVIPGKPDSYYKVLSDTGRYMPCSQTTMK